MCDSCQQILSFSVVRFALWYSASLLTKEEELSPHLKNHMISTQNSLNYDGGFKDDCLKSIIKYIYDNPSVQLTSNCLPIRLSKINL